MPLSCENLVAKCLRDQKCANANLSWNQTYSDRSYIQFLVPRLTQKGNVCIDMRLHWLQFCPHLRCFVDTHVAQCPRTEYNIESKKTLNNIIRECVQTRCAHGRGVSGRTRQSARVKRSERDEAHLVCTFTFGQREKIFDFDSACSPDMCMFCTWLPIIINMFLHHFVASKRMHACGMLFASR